MYLKVLFFLNTRKIVCWYHGLVSSSFESLNIFLPLCFLSLIESLLYITQRTYLELLPGYGSTQSLLNLHLTNHPDLTPVKTWCNDMCILFQIFCHLASSLKTGLIANACRALWRQSRINLNNKQTLDYNFSKHEIWLGTPAYFFPEITLVLLFVNS